MWGVYASQVIWEVKGCGVKFVVEIFASSRPDASQNSNQFTSRSEPQYQLVGPTRPRAGEGQIQHNHQHRGNRKWRHHWEKEDHPQGKEVQGGGGGGGRRGGGTTNGEPPARGEFEDGLTERARETTYKRWMEGARAEREREGWRVPLLGRSLVSLNTKCVLFFMNAILLPAPHFP